MSAFVHDRSLPAAEMSRADGEWPACEQVALPDDGSLRWLGLLLLGGTSLVTLRALVWAGQAMLAHL